MNGLPQANPGFCSYSYRKPGRDPYENEEDLSVIELSPRLFQAAVHWDLRDRVGASLYVFMAVYSLAKIGLNLRVAAIAHNELPRLRAHFNGISTNG